MNSLLNFVHANAIVLMAAWAVFSIALSALPTPEAFAAYYELAKCPNWYKSVYAIGHFVAMNWARVVPKMRMAQKDKP